MSSLLAFPASGGALILTMMRSLHSSMPWMPDELECGETITSISVPSLVTRTALEKSTVEHAPAT